MVLRASLLLIFKFACSQSWICESMFIAYFSEPFFKFCRKYIVVFWKFRNVWSHKDNLGLAHSYRYVLCSEAEYNVEWKIENAREEMTVQAQAKRPAKRPISWLLLHLTAKREHATTYKCVCVRMCIYVSVCVSASFAIKNTLILNSV